MTRINSSIRVKLLTDEHLLAEHREIKRIPFLFKQRKEAGIEITKNAPKKFTLGTGHVLFYLGKAAYTCGRYLRLREECLNRGFNVEDYSSNWKIYNDTDYIFNDYIPTKKTYNLLVGRISDRILGSTKEYWHYYGKQISKEKAIKILKADFGKNINI